MHRTATPALSVTALVFALATGCAHHNANQYAYAPPLMPPVYPQPQTVAQPVGVSGPVVAAPAMQAAPVVTGVPVTAAGGVVPANADGTCPPCAGATGAVPVAYEGPVQTQPCPPGP